MALSYTAGPSSLGHVLIAAAGEGLCAILLGDDAEELLLDLHKRFAADATAVHAPELAPTLALVIALIEHPAAGCTLTLAPRGTAFQRAVWAGLREIAPGTTTTYAALTATLGLPATSVRAVAGACSANPLAVAVPCHRVLRQDGALAGYRWGLDRKRILLDREAKVSTSPHQLTLL